MTLAQSFQLVIIRVHVCASDCIYHSIDVICNTDDDMFSFVDCLSESCELLLNVALVFIHITILWWIPDPTKSGNIEILACSLFPIIFFYSHVDSLAVIRCDSLLDFRYLAQFYYIAYNENIKL